jgi:hypothetical protein
MFESDDRSGDPVEAVEAHAPGLEVDLEILSSVTLARLVEEVKHEGLPSLSRYDRTYNRHNR